MTKFYTGVGSRETPESVLRLMKKIAIKLSELGYCLRSGGADGADSAFEAGARFKRIFTANQATPEAIKIAAKFHPAWHRCGEYARKLHGRNSFQVLGENLNTPSSFLICWTRDGATSHTERSIKTGGTGTAISIANHYNIPVFNLNRPKHFKRLSDFIK